MILNIGLFDTTVNNAFIKHFKSKGLKVGMNEFFKNTVIINNIKYVLKDYKVNNSNYIIAILKGA